MQGPPTRRELKPSSASLRNIGFPRWTPERGTPKQLVLKISRAGTQETRGLWQDEEQFFKDQHRLTCPRAQCRRSCQKSSLTSPERDSFALFQSRSEGQRLPGYSTGAGSCHFPPFPCLPKAGGLGVRLYIFFFSCFFFFISNCFCRFQEVPPVAVLPAVLHPGAPSLRSRRPLSPREEPPRSSAGRVFVSGDRVFSACLPGDTP